MINENFTVSCFFCLEGDDVIFDEGMLIFFGDWAGEYETKDDNKFEFCFFVG